jgi:hypothetical protein
MFPSWTQSGGHLTASVDLSLNAGCGGVAWADQWGYWGWADRYSDTGVGSVAW